MYRAVGGCWSRHREHDERGNYSPRLTDFSSVTRNRTAADGRSMTIAQTFWVPGRFGLKTALDWGRTDALAWPMTLTLTPLRAVVTPFCYFYLSKTSHPYYHRKLSQGKQISVAVKINVSHQLNCADCQVNESLVLILVAAIVTVQKTVKTYRPCLPNAHVLFFNYFVKNRPISYISIIFVYENNIVQV